MLKRYYHHLLIIAAMILVGCAQLGIAPADTTAKKIAAGYETVSALADATYNLRQQGVISATQKNDYANRLGDLKIGIDTAASLAVTNPQAADAKLQLIIAALTALQVELAKKGK